MLPITNLGLSLNTKFMEPPFVIQIRVHSPRSKHEGRVTVTLPDQRKHCFPLLPNLTHRDSYSYGKTFDFQISFCRVAFEIAAFNQIYSPGQEPGSDQPSDVFVLVYTHWEWMAAAQRGQVRSLANGATDEDTCCEWTVADANASTHLSFECGIDPKHLGVAPIVSPRSRKAIFQASAHRPILPLPPFPPSHERISCVFTPELANEAGRKNEPSLWTRVIDAKLQPEISLHLDRAFSIGLCANIDSYKFRGRTYQYQKRTPKFIECSPRFQELFRAAIQQLTDPQKGIKAWTTGGISLNRDQRFWIPDKAWGRFTIEGFWLTLASLCGLLDIPESELPPCFVPYLLAARI
jgi:hypothetical protein